MSDHTTDRRPPQIESFEGDATRSLLDQLLTDSRLYQRSQDYKDLLDFVVRLRSFAPFNAMLLHVQKPGLSYAASTRDWRTRFGRGPKEGARPLLILRPFGPVALVYDVLDTEGDPLPEDAASFVARGSVDEFDLESLVLRLKKKHIDCHWVDAGDRSAGLIRVVKRASNEIESAQYQVHINRNHEAAVRFTTLAHELGHLFLGHLGQDRKLKVPERTGHLHAQMELEAESVSFIVCERNGVKSKSQTYLSQFVDANTTVNSIDLYQVMRAAGQVEALIGVAVPSTFGSSGKHAKKKSSVEPSAAIGRPPNAGIDPQSMMAGIQLAGFHIEAGSRSFAAYSKAMIEDGGEVLRPFLRMWYTAIRGYPGFDNTGMQTDVEIDLEAAGGKIG